jgi:hypothetical protein
LLRGRPQEGTLTANRKGQSPKGPWPGRYPLRESARTFAPAAADGLDDFFAVVVEAASELPARKAVEAGRSRASPKTCACHAHLHDGQLFGMLPCRHCHRGSGPGQGCTLSRRSRADDGRRRLSATIGPREMAQRLALVAVASSGVRAPSGAS